MRTLCLGWSRPASRGILTVLWPLVCTVTTVLSGKVMVSAPDGEISFLVPSGKMMDTLPSTCLSCQRVIFITEDS